MQNPERTPSELREMVREPRANRENLRARLVDLVHGGDGIVGPRIDPEYDDAGTITGYRVTEAHPTPDNPDGKRVIHVETLDQANRLINTDEIG